VSTISEMEHTLETQELSDSELDAISGGGLGPGDPGWTPPPGYGDGQPKG
jgi:bacteriocin-like protein